MATAPNRLTPEEFLDFERRSEVKHEMIRGRIFAMPGGTMDHGRIAANLVGALNSRFRGGPCEAVGSDLKVHIPKGTFVYPDVTVVCGGPEFVDGIRDTLLNPVVIIEVLSPGSQDRDRGEKFEAYRRVLSLREYILVAQDRPMIEHFVRDSQTSWILNVVQGVEATLSLPSIGVSVPFSEIYERVVFEDEAAAS